MCIVGSIVNSVRKSAFAGRNMTKFGPSRLNAPKTSNFHLRASSPILIINFTCILINKGF